MKNFNLEMALIQGEGQYDPPILANDWIVGVDAQSTAQAISDLINDNFQVCMSCY